MPIVVRIDTRGDGDERQSRAVLEDRMDMSWMPRAQIEKRCCDARDIRETVTTRGMRELARIREWRVSDPALAQDRSSGG